MPTIEDAGNICLNRPRFPPRAVEPMMMIMMMILIRIFQFMKSDGEFNHETPLKCLAII